MLRRPIMIPAILYFFSFLSIAISLFTAFQILSRTLPLEAARLAAVPFMHLSHTLGGPLFAIIGPIQFGRVLARKYGRAHRIMGRVFVISGAALAISSITLLWKFPDSATPIVSGGRLVFGIGLGVALAMAMIAIRKRNIDKHRNWMIRAYALGAGATIVSIVFLPIYMITGEPPMGLVSDIAFIGSWAVCVLFAEVIIWRMGAPR